MFTRNLFGWKSCLKITGSLNRETIPEGKSSEFWLLMSYIARWPSVRLMYWFPSQLTPLKLISTEPYGTNTHDDVIKWNYFPRYWHFVRGIHRSPVNSPHKGQWRGALMFSLICVWINDWVNNREAGDLRRHRAHYDVIVMIITP